MLELYHSEYFLQRLQCSRTDREDTLLLIDPLFQLFQAARKGMKAVDDLLFDEHWRARATPFLHKAVEFFTVANDAKQIRLVLCNLIFSSGLAGRQCLQAAMTAETVVAVYEQQSSDFIFSFLIPSYFGLDMASQVSEYYQAARKSNSL